MATNILDFLNLLDFGDDNALFQQRETGEARTPFEMELQLYSFISRGAPDEMLDFYGEMLSSEPQFRLSVGKLSQDMLRQTKYLAVSMVAVICRVAMISGVSEAVAYGHSDDTIQKLDKLDDPDEILRLEMQAIYEFACLVAESKAVAAYSRPIQECIEYITVNLHNNITLEMLAESCQYSSTYLAKLFKNEVGQSVGDYILSRRIEEAKKMIKSGKTARETAYLLHFCSESYFIKQFKKVTGMTPKEYRNLRYNRTPKIE